VPKSKIKSILVRAEYLSEISMKYDIIPLTIYKSGIILEI